MPDSSQENTTPHTSITCARHVLATYHDLLADEGVLVRTYDAIKNSPDMRQEDVLVEGITYDSRKVKPGWLFVCKGAHFEERYLFNALEQGACAVVFETGFLACETREKAQTQIRAATLPTSCLFIEVANLRAALPLIANHFYNRVWERITTIGITGTKGKSTTTYYVKNILDAWAAAVGKPPTAVLSSIDAYDGVESHESHITTPEIFELYQHLANAEASGIQHLVMEVSSQGLKYARTAGVTYDIGCFLNIGEDHISDIEHTDAEDYFVSKLLFFSQCKTAIINAATDKAERVFGAAFAALPAQNILTFSADATVAADLQASEVTPIRRPGFDGLSFVAVDASDENDKRELFELGMTGTFNVENALAAISIARTLSVPEQFIHQGLYQVLVPGRMELFRMPNGAVIIIDYAHNWMSFERLFDSVAAEYPNTRRTIVFGCPGYKALGRRYELGTLSGRFCDMTYLTEEDAGEEPVQQICDEIATFVKAEGGAVTIILDREEAIRASLEDALADESGKTVVMLTGKGRETRQKRGQEYIPVTSDLEIVETFLAAL